jgi:hypothetical protein
MSWLSKLFGRGDEQPTHEKTERDITEERLDKWVEKIVTEEFEGVAHVYRMMGLHESTREIRRADGTWVAEIGFCYITRKFYRTIRDYPYIGQVPHA